MKSPAFSERSGRPKVAGMTTQDIHSRPATPASSGAALPLGPGRWVADPTHSSILFSIRHLGLSKVRGHFSQFDAWLEVGRSLQDTRVEASIDMASVDTNQTERDEHLRAPNFFDVANHPTMRFVSTRITGAGDDWHMEGELTVLGRTQPFGLDVEFFGARAPAETGLENLEEYQALHAGFGATGELKRSDFGLDFGIPASAGVLLGDSVKFDLDLELVEPTS